MILIFMNNYLNFWLICFKIRIIQVRYYLKLLWKIYDNIVCWRDSHIWIPTSGTFLMIISFLKSCIKMRWHRCLKLEQWLDFAFKDYDLKIRYEFRLFCYSTHLLKWYGKYFMINDIVSHIVDVGGDTAILHSVLL